MFKPYRLPLFPLFIPGHLSLAWLRPTHPSQAHGKFWARARPGPARAGPLGPGGAKIRYLRYLALATPLKASPNSAEPVGTRSNSKCFEDSFGLPKSDLKPSQWILKYPSRHHGYRTWGDLRCVGVRERSERNAFLPVCL